MTNESKPVVITGGTGGLGHAVVKRLIGEYVCAVPYMVEDEWRSLHSEVGSERLIGAKLDLTDQVAVARFLSDVQKAHGPIYGVVNLAGGFAGGSVEETSLDDWNKLLTLNLTTAFLVTHLALPQLRQRGEGRVLTISSAAALDRPKGLVAYNVSKIGVATLVESLANELKGTRITANTLQPGSMATPAMLKQMRADKLVPLRRVADTIAFLLSEAGGGISGASIPITVTSEA
jgi:NAD(P)-dependent dehydrogenase (short-subunit alcohol dehydrogenase family)